MGVTGLWQIVHPCSRPTNLDRLNRSRLAVDASIWIYQFLKAVRDKEGNALRNSHVVGFFQRICKLLFFGIKPVFVFDGGAPSLKRQTITQRKKRREGRRDDAARTAGRLLAVQMQRRAEEEEQRRREERDRGQQDEETVPDEGLVYADENLMTQQERQQNRKFRKKDAYHLPELDVSMSEMGGANDPRVMSLEELQAYAKQFEEGEDINVYDFSKIDYDSPFFMSLPASDRYNILNAARLRSRLRMGYSKEQLDGMYPNRMDFSRFQIERVTERNELTQRLMHINEGGDTLFNGGGRVAGEKGREYVLVKNDGVEGGWALGVISDEGTKQETAIDLDKPAPVIKQENEWEDEDDFEDVPIEGLNRLPKRPKDGVDSADSYSKQRQAVYKSRKPAAKRQPKAVADPNSLFVQEDSEGHEEEWEDVDGNAELFGEGGDEQEDEDLNRAIAMSLQEDNPTASQDNHLDSAKQDSEAEEDDMLEVFNQSAVPDARPIPKGSGRGIASLVNKRAFDTAPESNEVTSFGVPGPKPDDDADASDHDDSVDLQAALAESRKTKRKVSPPQRHRPSDSNPSDSATQIAKQSGFSGPLPFEKLDLGSSLLGRKKMQERSEAAAGGFENPELETQEQQKDKKKEPLPPWFSGSVEVDIEKQKALESEDRERAKEFNKQFQFQKRDDRTLRNRDDDEVIDLEAEDVGNSTNGEVVDLEAEDNKDEADDGMITIHAKPQADTNQEATIEDASENVDDAEVSQEKAQQDASPAAEKAEAKDDDDDEEMLEWSESEDEKAQSSQAKSKHAPKIEDPAVQEQRSRSPSVEFEDVGIPDEPGRQHHATTEHEASGVTEEGEPDLLNQDGLLDDVETAEFEEFSDPEDEELLRQLTLEAEEHARFASTLNNKTQAQNIADYEKELKQLRNQQMKDRRDADEVTHTMVQECQQLLALFGLPYITAPMEAEAQCAELVRLGLVDGIITDDSDCFLFGGTRIFKNMFNQAKFVECYTTADIEKEFDLTREKMIQIAHLLGSDYTEGLPGVGPVTATEILGEFETLEEFKTWITGVQMNTIPKSEDAGNAFRKKFRRTATKIFLPPEFPDVRVDAAYLKPEVDSDPEKFQWGVPDLESLRTFLMATIGWSQERTDEVLVPVIKDMNRRIDEGTQSNITAFFDGAVGVGAAAGKGKKDGEGSKRMGSALNRMAEKAKMRRTGKETESVENGGKPNTSAAKKKTASKKRTKNDTSEASDGDDDSDFEGPKKKAKKKAGVGKSKGGQRQRKKIAE